MSPSNPYPGARPLEAWQGELLRGRTEFARDLVRDIAGKRVIELTADSGVGKSSLLDAKIIPMLQDAGALVVVFRSWARLSTRSSGEDLYAAAVGLAVSESKKIDLSETDEFDVDNEPVRLVEYLEGKYNQKLVVIFDQLEELFRDDERMGNRFMVSLAENALTTRFHHILSLRSEYKVALAAVERRLPTDIWRWYPLPPVADGVAAEIIEEPVRQKGDDEASWQETASLRVASLWASAREGSWQIGLLHLQAFLWVTWERLSYQAEELRVSPMGEIGLERLKAVWPGSDVFEDELIPAREADRSVALFERALSDYVTLRLGSVPPGEEGQRKRDVMFAMARTVPHLSSDGYKLIRGVKELAGVALPQLADLRIDPQWTNAQLDAPEVRHGEIDDAETGDLVEGSFAGDETVPAGRMRGKSAIETAQFLIDTFRAGLQQLADEAIVRFTPTGTRGTRIALIHDGFGPALDLWSEAVLDHPDATLDSVTQISARQLFRPIPSPDGEKNQRFAPDQEGSMLTEVSKASWLSCYIKADFESVTFVECDLRSTLFRGCKFTQVVFKNCQMSGVLFMDCKLENVKVENDDSDIPETDVRTLQFVESTIQGEEGIWLKGVKGYGVLFDHCQGGPWRVIDCDLQHVMLDIQPGDASKAGAIENSKVRYVSLSNSLRQDCRPAIVGKCEVKKFDKGLWNFTWASGGELEEE